MRVRPHLVSRNDLIERYHVRTQIEVIRLVEIMLTRQSGSAAVAAAAAAAAAEEDSFIIPATDASLLLDPNGRHSMTYHMSRHDDVIVRRNFYQFAARMHGQKDLAVVVQDMIHQTLVDGLNDRSKKIRALIKYFFHHGTMAMVENSAVGSSPVGEDVTGRLRLLLTQCNEKDGRNEREERGGLFNTKMEDRWLEYASFLTLSLTERTSDFDRHLPGCEDKLEDCEFVEVDVLASSELMTMQPKYSNLVSQMSSYAEHGSSMRRAR